jgi:hypothetical protein
MLLGHAMSTPVTDSLPFDRKPSVTIESPERATSVVPVGLLRESLVVVAQPLLADLHGVGRILEDGETLELAVAPTRAARNRLDPRVERCRLGNRGSMAWHALEAPHVMVCSHLLADQQTPFAHQFLSSLGVATSLTMPIKHRNEPIGLMALYWTTPREFSQKDIGLFKAVAASLKPLIELGEQTREASVAERTEQSWPADAAAMPDSENGTGRERRSTERKPFRYLQRITYAATDPGSFSTRNSVNVECLDISGGGMSFFVGSPPEFKEFVAELGTSQGVRLVKACVVRVHKARVGNRLGYVVGCQFVGRVEL